jgi:hypothetical protein
MSDRNTQSIIAGLMWELGRRKLQLHKSKTGLKVQKLLSLSLREKKENFP